MIIYVKDKKKGRVKESQRKRSMKMKHMHLRIKTLMNLLSLIKEWQKNKDQKNWKIVRMIKSERRTMTQMMMK